MLTHGVLNAQLAQAMAGLRHKDQFVISDCGLPVPDGVEVIDLALVFVFFFFLFFFLFYCFCFLFCLMYFYF